MTSTQRSESMNRILKRNFVRERHDLHIFAEKVDRCIQTRKGIEHAENMANEVCNIENILIWMSESQSLLLPLILKNAVLLCINTNEMRV